MKRVSKSVLLWYSAMEMYGLVADVERYPEFLPWCERSEVLARDAASMTARLHLHFNGLRHAFTTRNRLEPGRRLGMTLVDGPFSALDGQWRFTPIGDDAVERACRIEFDLAYAFVQGAALNVALAPVFDRVADTFVDSFVRRAEQVFGER